jgi:DNA processing protein
MRTISDDELARVAWSRLAEPADGYAYWFINMLGAPQALSWLYTTAAASPSVRRKRIVELLGAGLADWADSKPADGVGLEPVDGVGLVDAVSAYGVGSTLGSLTDGGLFPAPPSGPPGRLVSGLNSAVEAWARRLPVDPERDLRTIRRLDGTVITPSNPAWPPGLTDLGPTAPLCLWLRGDYQGFADRVNGVGPGGLIEPAVALVGARAATAYGTHLAADLAAGLTERGFTIASGGAFGIDIAAHQATLATGGRTVVFLAGGLDQPYPLANAETLHQILEDSGLWLGESPPGTKPARHRFLQRNRLIAATARAVVVVEAAWRSGALNTATHAAQLFRPVGAVPGPVTSAASAGCHRLLREGAAVCVTDAEEVAELAGPLVAGPDTSPPSPGDRAPDLDPTGLRVWDALGDRKRRTAEQVAQDAGLAIGPTLAVLGRFEARGIASVANGTWLRAKSETQVSS